ncbi:MAG: type I-C CRISPR-associated protein Cas5c [Syntrophales bacterium]|jgi:CRISPR-associated protein Cas5d|nr:type I-C CRISPR-associated protein Cas5c [Syntrophales bacterium]
MNEKFVKGRTLSLRVWGKNACFTRPEMKVERVSYDVMTPSAARGVLEAILWKPAIRWQVEQIDILNPIRWESIRRNEVGAVMSPQTSGFFIEEQRQQRAGLFLREVAYTIHACFWMTDRAGPDDNVKKFEAMFLRRAGKGQCFNQPYLGCREFSAHFAPLTDDQALPEPISETRDLGWMLFDIKHDAKSDDGNHVHCCTTNCRPSFFRAFLQNGRLDLRKAEVRS